MEPLSTEGGIFESRFVDRVFSTPLVTMAAVEVSMNSSCFTDCGSCPVSIAIASVEEVVDNTDGGFDWSIPRELRLVTLGGLKSASDGFTSTCCCCWSGGMTDNGGWAIGSLAFFWAFKAVSTLHTHTHTHKWCRWTMHSVLQMWYNDAWKF